MTSEEAIIRIKGLYGNGYAEQEQALDMAIKALEQEPKWIDVSERLPGIGEDVLVCDIDGDIYVNYLHSDTCLNKWGYDAFGDKIKNIIAWMPLPEPYKEESEDKECI